MKSQRNALPEQYCTAGWQTFRSLKWYSTIGIPPVSGFLHDTTNSYDESPIGLEIIASGLGTPAFWKL